MAVALGWWAIIAADWWAVIALSYVVVRGGGRGGGGAVLLVLPRPWPRRTAHQTMLQKIVCYQPLCCPHPTEKSGIAQVYTGSTLDISGAGSRAAARDAMIRKVSVLR